MKIVSLIAFTATVLASSYAPAFAQDSDTTDICAGLGSDVSTGAEQLAAVQAATTAVVIELEGCTGSLPAEFTDALLANEAISAVLQQESVGAGEIIGIGVEETNVTVYVSGDE